MITIIFFDSLKNCIRVGKQLYGKTHCYNLTRTNCLKAKTRKIQKKMKKPPPNFEKAKDKGMYIYALWQNKPPGSFIHNFCGNIYKTFCGLLPFGGRTNKKKSK